MTDRPTCPPDHIHEATGTCYNEHGCRCLPCRARNSAYKRDVYRRHAYGMPTAHDFLVDAEPARQHIQYLRDYGIGVAQIADLAGLPKYKVDHIVWGNAVRTRKRSRPPTPAIRVHHTTGAAILAVRPDPSILSDASSVPARGAHRRIQALGCLGWSLRDISARIGTDQNGAYRILKQSHITAHTHRALEVVFAELWNQERPHADGHDLAVYTRSVRQAERRRWLPPLAWDDIDNDPTPPVVERDSEAIDEIAVELALTGEPVRLTIAERHRVVATLHARKWSDERIAAYGRIVCLLGESVRLSSDERREAVRRLHVAKWSDERIAETLRCASRTVLRIRQELGLETHEFGELRKRGAA